MKIDRRFTRRGVSPYEGLAFVKRASEIRNPDGSTVFKLENIDVPETWSQLAVDILAQKYFRKAGIPQHDQTGQPLVGSDGKPGNIAANLQSASEFLAAQKQIPDAALIATSQEIRVHWPFTIFIG